LQLQAEAVVAEVELVRLTQVDLEEAVAILHVQVLQEMQAVIVHLKETTAVLQLAQPITVVAAAEVLVLLVQIILENLEAQVVLVLQIQYLVRL
jgi:hypothetical protein